MRSSHREGKRRYTRVTILFLVVAVAVFTFRSSADGILPNDVPSKDAFFNFRGDALRKPDHGHKPSLTQEDKVLQPPSGEHAKPPVKEEKESVPKKEPEPAKPEPVKEESKPQSKALESPPKIEEPAKKVEPEPPKAPPAEPEKPKEPVEPEKPKEEVKEPEKPKEEPKEVKESEKPKEQPTPTPPPEKVYPPAYPDLKDPYAIQKRGSKFLLFQGFKFLQGMPKYYTESVENKRLYAELHGYDYKLDSPDDVNPERPSVWHKIIAPLKYLPHYEWVCWIDIDAVIMNIDRKLEDIVACNNTCDVVAAKTFEAFAIGEETKENEHRLNGGVWCVKNTTWGKFWLNSVYNKTDMVDHFNYEQRAMQVLLRDNPSWQSHVKFVNEHDLNIHNWDWREGDFVVHYYGGLQGCWDLPGGCTQELKNRCNALKEVMMKRLGRWPASAPSRSSRRLAELIYPARPPAHARGQHHCRAGVIRI